MKDLPLNADLSREVCELIVGIVHNIGLDYRYKLKFLGSLPFYDFYP
jgi:hypothetical protein